MRDRKDSDSTVGPPTSRVRTFASGRSGGERTTSWRSRGRRARAEVLREVVAHRVELQADRLDASSAFPEAGPARRRGGQAGHGGEARSLQEPPSTAHRAYPGPDRRNGITARVLPPRCGPGPYPAGLLAAPRPASVVNPPSRRPVSGRCFGSGRRGGRPGASGGPARLHGCRGRRQWVRGPRRRR